jgi:thiamine biosynthesis lipoprotein
MGTEVVLVSDDPFDALTFDRAARSVERVFAAEERRFSRFRQESELSRVNARAGGWTDVTPRFAEVVRLALDAARETNGLFDPTVLPTLEALGYDRDFDEIVGDPHTAHNPAASGGRWADVELDRDRIRLPASVRLDLGGIAKGWTADRAAEIALDGLAWALVSAGGDLRLAGTPPEAGVEVGVEDAERPGAELCRLTLEHGALATSCITKRAWGRGLHHLIDPRTGSPAGGAVLQATVWAPACARAEVLAKQTLLDGGSTLERLDALLLLSDGTVVSNLSADEPTRIAK